MGFFNKAAINDSDIKGILGIQIIGKFIPNLNSKLLGYKQKPLTVYAYEYLLFRPQHNILCKKLKVR